MAAAEEVGVEAEAAEVDEVVTKFFIIDLCC